MSRRDMVATERAICSLLAEIDILEHPRCAAWLDAEDSFLAEAEARIKALRTRATSRAKEAA